MGGGVREISVHRLYTSRGCDNLNKFDGDSEKKQVKLVRRSFNSTSPNKTTYVIKSCNFHDTVPLRNQIIFV